MAYEIAAIRMTCELQGHSPTASRLKCDFLRTIDQIPTDIVRRAVSLR